MSLAVTRYDFPVPEWCRTIWASPGARATWEPRIRAINAAWAETELASVGEVRKAALVVVDPARLDELSGRATGRGLLLVTLAREGGGGSYAAAQPVVDGRPWRYRAVLCEPRVAVPFASAWHARDDLAMGLMLGFPLCCAQFFQRVWVEERWRDTTWPMAIVAHEDGHGEWSHHSPEPTLKLQEDQDYIRVTGPNECNILWRWLGPRLVPHLPCSFSCEQTRQRGQELRGVMRRAGHAQEVEWLDELLSWQVEWSAWHGVAEVKTPILKFSVKTDATEQRLVVRREGAYPATGARGVSFPHERHPVRILRPRDWVDNGFSTHEAQERGHEMVLSALRQHPPQGAVLDLGCGNGLLLRRVRAEHGVEVVGVERDAAKVREPWVAIGDLCRVDELLDGLFDTVIVSVRRFEEVPTLREWAHTHARQVIEYSYDEPTFARKG